MTAAEFKKTAGSIFDTTLGASAASIDVTSISNTYAHLMISLYARGDTAALVASVVMRFNGDTAANYDYQAMTGAAAATSASENFGQTGMLVNVCPANTAGANLFGAAEIFVPNYAGSSNNKQAVSMSSSKSGTSTTNMRFDVFGCAWRSSAAINQVTFLPTAGNFVAGTRLTIHALGA